MKKTNIFSDKNLFIIALLITLPILTLAFFLAGNVIQLNTLFGASTNCGAANCKWKAAVSGNLIACVPCVSGSDTSCKYDTFNSCEGSTSGAYFNSTAKACAACTLNSTGCNYANVSTCNVAKTGDGTKWGPISGGNFVTCGPTINGSYSDYASCALAMQGAKCNDDGSVSSCKLNDSSCVYLATSIAANYCKPAPKAAVTKLVINSYFDVKDFSSNDLGLTVTGLTNSDGTLIPTPSRDILYGDLNDSSITRYATTGTQINIAIKNESKLNAAGVKVYYSTGACSESNTTSLINSAIGFGVSGSSYNVCILYKQVTPSGITLNIKRFYSKEVVDLIKAVPTRFNTIVSDSANKIVKTINSYDSTNYTDTNAASGLAEGIYKFDQGGAVTNLVVKYLSLKGCGKSDSTNPSAITDTGVQYTSNVTSGNPDVCIYFSSSTNGGGSNGGNNGGSNPGDGGTNPPPVGATYKCSNKLCAPCAAGDDIATCKYTDLNACSTKSSCTTDGDTKTPTPTTRYRCDNKQCKLCTNSDSSTECKFADAAACNAPGACVTQSNSSSSTPTTPAPVMGYKCNTTSKQCEQCDKNTDPSCSSDTASACMAANSACTPVTLACTPSQSGNRCTVYDVFNDCRVDVRDFGFFKIAYLQSGASTCSDPRNFDHASDTASSCAINVFDFSRFRKAYYCFLNTLNNNQCTNVEACINSQGPD